MNVTPAAVGGDQEHGSLFLFVYYPMMMMMATAMMMILMISDAGTAHCRYGVCRLASFKATRRCSISQIVGSLWRGRGKACDGSDLLFDLVVEVIELRAI